MATKKTAKAAGKSAAKTKTKVKPKAKVKATAVKKPKAAAQPKSASRRGSFTIKVDGQPLNVSQLAAKGFRIGIVVELASGRNDQDAMRKKIQDFLDGPEFAISVVALTKTMGGP